MLSVIIDACDDPDLIAGLLAALTPGAIENVIREVQIIEAHGDGAGEALGALCDATGAQPAKDWASAIPRARGDWILAAPAAFRPRAGWVEKLGTHFRNGGGAVVLKGEGGSLFRPAPTAIVIAKIRAEALVHPELKGLRGQLGPAVTRIG